MTEVTRVVVDDMAVEVEIMVDGTVLVAEEITVKLV
jgi:hypothetical protein